MTKEEAKEYLDNYRKMYAELAPERFLEALDIMLNEPSLPSNLDEAAKEYANIQDDDDREKYVNGYLYNGFFAGAKWRDAQIPKLPDNIDEASFYYAEACKYEGGEKLLCAEHFKAGAGWMAEQGVTKECPIGMATEKIICNITEKTLDTLGICPGDKVIVHIRKANEKEK